MVGTRDERTRSQLQTSCGFVKLTLLLCRTRMREEIQAEWVFKYYGLPKKVIELDGRLGKT